MAGEPTDSSPRRLNRAVPIRETEKRKNQEPAKQIKIDLPGSMIDGLTVSDEPNIKHQIGTATNKDKRAALRTDKPWCRFDNPHIWEGNTGDDAMPMMGFVGRSKNEDS